MINKGEKLTQNSSINTDEKFFECKHCNNDWTLTEGFNLNTMQCKSCQDWDDSKPLRDKENKERQEFRKTMRNIDFEYVPGDPFW